MSDKNLETVQDLIIRDFELEAGEELLSEAALLELLSKQVAYWIENKLEFLLSLMYRLDIDEAKVSHALSPYSEEAPDIAIARLILNRQKQRVFTKQHYKQQQLEGWEWEAE